MARQLSASSLALVLCLALAGCGPEIHTRTVTWPNGKTALEEHYYLDRDPWGDRALHGTVTYWRQDGTVFAQGEWRDGKPWSGVCWIPAAGDAGSAGCGRYRRYRNGEFVELVQLRHRIWGEPLPEAEKPPGTAR